MPLFFLMAKRYHEESTAVCLLQQKGAKKGKKSDIQSSQQDQIRETHKTENTADIQFVFIGSKYRVASFIYSKEMMAASRFSKQLFQKKNILVSSVGSGPSRALSSVVGNAAGKSTSSLTSKYTIGFSLLPYFRK